MPNELEQANINDKALQNTMNNASEANELIAQVDEQYGDGMPYEENRILFAIRENMSSYARSMYEMGRYLILLKAHTPHGQFKEKIEVIDMPYGLAKQAMHVANKIDINGKTGGLLNLNKSKVIELAKEDVKELEDLVYGGTLAGKTLDEIDKMSVKELRKTLRDEREKKKQDIEAKEHILSDKNRKIDEQAEQINKLSAHTRHWDETAKNFNAELATIFSDIFDSTDRLDKMGEEWRKLNFEFTQGPDDDIGVSSEAVSLMEQEYTHRVSKVFELVIQLTQDVDMAFNSQIIEAYFNQNEQEAS